MGTQKKGRDIMQPAHIFNNRAPVKPEFDLAKSLYPKLAKTETDDIPDALIPDEVTQADGKKFKRTYNKKSKPEPAPEVDDDNSPEG